MESKVFVSYARNDSDFVNGLADQLRRLGISLWMDSTDIKLGDRWEESIEHAIRDASTVLVLVSPDASKSRWVQHEIELGKRYNKPIVAVLLKGGENAVKALHLEQSAYVVQSEDSTSKLVELVERSLNTASIKFNND